MNDTNLETVELETADAVLFGNLLLPPATKGLVLFAHGSGSSRFSPRNRFVAAELNRGGIGTLLFDLLTAEESERDEITAELRFDIDLLSRRLGDAVRWAQANPRLQGLKIGLFGASTGAAAALRVAAGQPEAIAAVVSRGGRPDLAGNALAKVVAPTLLIVGGLDDVVIGLNREAQTQLAGERHLEIVPGAGHLFEQPGKLEAVARLALGWFKRYLDQETS